MVTIPIFVYLINVVQRWVSHCFFAIVKFNPSLYWWRAGFFTGTPYFYPFHIYNLYLVCAKFRHITSRCSAMELPSRQFSLTPSHGLNLALCAEQSQYSFSFICWQWKKFSESLWIIKSQQRARNFCTLLFLLAFNHFAKVIRPLIAGMNTFLQRVCALLTVWLMHIKNSVVSCSQAKLA